VQLYDQGIAGGVSGNVHGFFTVRPHPWVRVLGGCGGGGPVPEKCRSTRGLLQRSIKE
jgi:hypothetical protein